MKLYTTDEVVQLTGAGKQTVQVFARTKNVAYVGSGNRKTYTWTEEDVLRFKNRNKRIGKPFGAGKKSAAIIEYINNHPGATGKEISKATGADAGQISKIRKKLIQ